MSATSTRSTTRGRGMKPAFLALGGLLLGVALLIAILSLTGALTGFGS